MRLRNYSEKPPVKFWGTDDYYLGMELEVEAPNGEARSIAIKPKIMGLHAKRDGSLDRDRGVEIITHPFATLAARAPVTGSPLRNGRSVSLSFVIPGCQSALSSGSGNVIPLGISLANGSSWIELSASRALVETNTIGQGQHTVIQGTLTVSERGFSVPYTQKLESLAIGPSSVATALTQMKTFAEQLPIRAILISIMYFAEC